MERWSIIFSFFGEVILERPFLGAPIPAIMGRSIEIIIGSKSYYVEKIYYDYDQEIVSVILWEH